MQDALVLLLAELQLFVQSFELSVFVRNSDFVLSFNLSHLFLSIAFKLAYSFSVRFLHRLILLGHLLQVFRALDYLQFLFLELAVQGFNHILLLSPCRTDSVLQNHDIIHRGMLRHCQGHSPAIRMQ